VFPPKVLDMFAGGGAIPRGVLRLGCELCYWTQPGGSHHWALPWFIRKSTERIWLEVEKWGNWVIENVRAEIMICTHQLKWGSSPREILSKQSYFQSQPKQLSSAKTPTPVAYLWTRTVKCPTQPAVRQCWCARLGCVKRPKKCCTQSNPNYQTKQVEFEVVETTTEKAGL